MGKDNISCQMWEYLLSAGLVKIESEVAFLDGVEAIYGWGLIWLIITKGFGKQHHVAARILDSAFFSLIKSVWMLMCVSAKSTSIKSSKLPSTPSPAVLHFFRAAPWLVKVLKLFETPIYLLVYRKCFKWREKKTKPRILSKEQRGEGSFISSWMLGQAPFYRPDKILMPTTRKAAWLVEMRFPAVEELRSKYWGSYLGLGISGSSSSFLWPSLAKMQPLEGAGAQASQDSPAWFPDNWGFMESLCCWNRGIHGDEYWVGWGLHGGNTVLCTLSITPTPVPLPQGHPTASPRPSPRWATAEYENRQENPSWSFPGMQTIS